MTREEKQLIRRMNRSFKEKKSSRKIEISDLTDAKETSNLVSGYDEVENDDLIGVKNGLHAYNLNPDYEINQEADISDDFGVTTSYDDLKEIIKEGTKKTIEKIERKKRGALFNNFDIPIPDDIVGDNEKDFFNEHKPLVQEFVLIDPWLPYSKDCRLTRFSIKEDESVDLDFFIPFNRPPHLRHTPSDLNNPLGVLKRFKKLIEDDDAKANYVKVGYDIRQGDNIRCYVSYSYHDDCSDADNGVTFNITGKIASMEIQQGGEYGLKITVSGKIIR